VQIIAFFLPLDKKDFAAIIKTSPRLRPWGIEIERE